jgi:hypothetical protein
MLLLSVERRGSQVLRIVNASPSGSSSGVSSKSFRLAWGVEACKLLDYLKHGYVARSCEIAGLSIFRSGLLVMPFRTLLLFGQRSLYNLLVKKLGNSS